MFWESSKELCLTCAWWSVSGGLNYMSWGQRWITVHPLCQSQTSGEGNIWSHLLQSWLQLDLYNAHAYIHTIHSWPCKVYTFVYNNETPNDTHIQSGISCVHSLVVLHHNRTLDYRYELREQAGVNHCLISGYAQNGRIYTPHKAFLTY